jgi:hypothetical protein
MKNDRIELNIETQGNRTRIALSGRLNEDADLSPLVERIRKGGLITIDLGKVTRINSSGMRGWMEVVKAAQDGEVELEACPVAFVQQANLVANFVGSMRIKSLYAPFACHRCDAFVEKLLAIEQIHATIEPPACESCRTKMEPDFWPESYLAFLEPRPEQKSTPRSKLSSEQIEAAQLFEAKVHRLTSRYQDRLRLARGKRGAIMLMFKASKHDRGTKLFEYCLETNSFNKHTDEHDEPLGTPESAFKKYERALRTCGYGLRTSADAQLMASAVEDMVVALLARDPILGSEPSP